MRINTKIASLVALMAMSATMVNAKDFSYTENFDEDAGGAYFTNLPDGWASEDASEPFKRYRDKYIMSGTAHSGDYVIGTLQTTSSRDSWLFSKKMTLKAGVKYTIKYWLRMPGGVAAPFNNNVITNITSSQSKANVVAKLGETGRTKIADWQQMTYEFTPETSGDYYIAFNIITTLYNSDYVAIDDLEVTGEEPDDSGDVNPGGGSETPDTPEISKDLISEDFDSDEGFTDKGIPAGWTSTGAIPLKRDKASVFGLDAHSGDYILGTTADAANYGRNEEVYTRMMTLKGGVEYTLSFWYKAPGGGANPQYYSTTVITKLCNAQSSAGEIKTLGETTKEFMTEWKEATYKFTPESDGDYCISFKLNSMLNNCGAFGLDDIKVTSSEESGGGQQPGGGETPDQPGGGETPAQGTALISQNFDNDADFTDSKVPEGWKTEGTYTFERNKASYFGLTAHSGDYIFGANSSTEYYRQDAFYTKKLSLKAGVEYTVSFWYYAPGGSTKVNPQYYATNIITKVGTDQNSANMTTVLGQTEKEFMTEWKQATYKFTPDADGEYCFGFILDAQLSGAGAVGIDDIQITSPESGGEQPGGGETPDKPDQPDQPGGGETPVEMEDVLSEDFDNDENFTDGSKIPTGWVSTGAQPMERTKASYYGETAHSGAYIFGTLANMSANRNEEFYTSKISMKAGVKYTLKFWYKAPGAHNVDAFATQIITKVGTAQNAEAMTTTLGETPKKCQSEWTEATYDFTPETDGDYFFGFALSSSMSGAGFVGIDDIEVVAPKQSTEEPGGGDEPDDPNPELPDGVVCDLPYSQSFDNENNDYQDENGKKLFVPYGWLSTGTSPFTTANMSSLEAIDGTYYLIAPESTVKRDDRIYTPFFKMNKGTTYTAKFYLYMPGNIDNGTASDFTFTVGTEQDSEFHTPLLTKTAYTNSKWEEVNVDYTPTKTGYYCFSFALGGEDVNAGEVAIDMFSVKAPGMIAKPKAAFSYNGNFNMMDSKLIAFDNSEIQMVNQSTDADSCLWEVDGAVPATSKEMNPTFTFPESGSYKVKLTVKNVKGSSSTSETIDVTKFDDEIGSLPVSIANPNEDKLLNRDDIPVYDTDPEGDYVTGVNHYYRRIAERYNMPTGREYNLYSLSYYLCYYGLANGQYNQQKAAPVSIVVYADKNGRPDTDSIYGRYDTTMENAFGTMGLAKAEMRSLNFEKPIVAKGPFYVAFEFDKSFVLKDEDSQLSRSVFAVSGLKHRSKETTFFVLPDSVPENATCGTGKYVPVDSIDAEYNGLGLNIITWMKVNKEGTATNIAMTADGKLAFAVRLDANKLTVSGTQAGETVTVYNLAGQAVAKVTAKDVSTELSLATQPTGVYVVSTAAGTRKFVKK